MSNTLQETVLQSLHIAWLTARNTKGNKVKFIGGTCTKREMMMRIESHAKFIKRHGIAKYDTEHTFAHESGYAHNGLDAAVYALTVNP